MRGFKRFGSFDWKFNWFGNDNLPNKLLIRMPNLNVSVDRSLYSERFSFLNVNWPSICGSTFGSNDTAYKYLTVQNRWKNSHTPAHHRSKNNVLHLYSMEPIPFWIQPNKVDLCQYFVLGMIKRIKTTELHISRTFEHIYIYIQECRYEIYGDAIEIGIETFHHFAHLE